MPRPQWCADVSEHKFGNTIVVFQYDDDEDEDQDDMTIPLGGYVPVR